MPAPPHPDRRTVPSRLSRTLRVSIRVSISTLAVAGFVVTLSGAATPAPTADAVATRPVAAHAKGKPGSSGTIVFIRRHNVWIARGNGTGQHAVTHDGTATRPYRSPSEDDHGVIAAARGTEIVRLTQHGKKLSHFSPPRLRNSAGEPMDGTVNDVSLSPNGKRVAWSYVRYSCPVGVDCMIRYATGVSSAKKYHRAGVPITYYAPSWIGNGRVLASGGFLAQVMLHDLPQRKAKHWFDDEDYYGFDSTDLSDGEVSPNGKWVAQVRGYGSHRAIAWYAVKGDVTTGPPPVIPDIRCLTGDERKHAGPTWSPDSRALAWGAKQGIFILRSVADCGAGGQATLAFRNAKSPDWSKAALRR